METTNQETIRPGQGQRPDAASAVIQLELADQEAE